MSVGKYSPTISTMPRHLRTATPWEVDSEGYDYYGYNENGVDRAGNTADDYLTDYINTAQDRRDDEDFVDLFDEVQNEWNNIWRKL